MSPQRHQAKFSRTRPTTRRTLLQLIGTLLGISASARSKASTRSNIISGNPQAPDGANRDAQEDVDLCKTSDEVVSIRRFRNFEDFSSSTSHIENGSPILIDCSYREGDKGGGLFQFKDHICIGDGGRTVTRKSGGGIERIDKTEANVRWWGALGDGQTDDTSAFLRAIHSLNPNQNPIGKGRLNIPSGEYIISQSLKLTRQGITFVGENGTVLRWMGKRGEPMFHVVDCYKCAWIDMTILGSRDASPVGIFFDHPHPTTIGTNELHSLTRVIFGTLSGQQEENTFPLTIGLHVGGAINGNNDQFFVDKCVFHRCVDFGIKIDNPQSIWGSVRDTLLNQCGVGIYTSANITLQNTCFNRNTKNDLQVNRNVLVSAFGFNSENSVECLTISGGGSLFIDGGKILVSGRGIEPGKYWLRAADFRRIAIRNLTVVMHLGAWQEAIFIGSNEEDAFVSLFNSIISTLKYSPPITFTASKDRRITYEINFRGKAISGTIERSDTRTIEHAEH